MIVRVTRQLGTASLASYISTMLSMVHSAQLNGHRAWVDWRGQPAGLYRDAGPDLPENQWLWWLEQPMVAEAPLAAPLWVYEDPAWRAQCPIAGDLPWNAQTAEAIARLRAIVPSLLKIQERVRLLGDGLFARHGLDPAKAVAISIRGTDKHAEAHAAPAEAYVPVLERLQAQHPGLALWVQAEEAAANAWIRGRFPGAMVMEEFYQVGAAPGFIGSGRMADRTNPKSGYARGLDAVLLLYLFSRCAVLVKNASNLGDLAAGLSTGEIVGVP